MESPQARSKSLRARSKAIEVAKLLSDLSESDMTPCIAAKVELKRYAREVQGLVDQNTSINISDRLLSLLKGLSKGHISSRLRLDLLLTP
jgi:hypothetical protein